MIRIISGSKKGKKLMVLPDVTKPLTDRIKTSIFDLISEFVPNSTILDLFSGSGNFALEGVSRGAKWATIIESSPDAIQIIKGNIQNTQSASQTEVLCKDAFKFLQTKELSKYYDIIFLDPPFPFSNEDKQLLLNLSGIFLNKDNPDALIIFRYPKSEEYITRSIQEIYSKDYGISKVSFYRKKRREK